MLLTYLLLLAVGALTGNLWEETVWGGFVQGRLMARHGLLTGSLLTALPVFLIHGRSCYPFEQVFEKEVLYCSS